MRMLGSLLCFIALAFTEECTIAFVHIGKEFPSHMVHSIKQARLFNPEENLVVIGNEEAISKTNWEDLHLNWVPIESLPMSASHKRYLQATKMEGFWRYALERFFILDEYIQAYQFSNVFHIENDVMIYMNVQDMLPRFQSCYANKIATVFDCDERAVPSFVYIADPNSSSLLVDFLGRRSPPHTTDMEMLRRFTDAYQKNRADLLPILIPAYAEDYPLTNIFKNTAKSREPFSRHLEVLGLIFDAAALGQFLGGIDPILGESKMGFMGEASVFLPMYFDFNWRKDLQGRWIPYIAYKGIEYPIANLHIHSKKLPIFSSVNETMPEPPKEFYSSLSFEHIRKKQ